MGTAINVTQMLDFIGSFPKGSAARNYAGDYCDWLLQARKDEPKTYDYLISQRQATKIRLTAKYLHSLSRRVTHANHH